MAKLLSLRAGLRGTRKRAAEVTLEIARWEGSCLRRDYTTRWALVVCRVSDRHAAVLPFLRQHRFNADTSGRAVPSTISSTAAKETVLRTTAVDGSAPCHRWPF